MNDNERIKELRKRCRERKKTFNATFYRNYYRINDEKSFRESEGKSWQIRKALLAKSRFEIAKFAIDNQELLAGRLSFEEKFDEKLYQKAVDYFNTLPPVSGQTGHCELEFSRIFRVGVDGLIEDIKARKKNAKGQKAETYQSFLIVLEGFSTFIENAGKTAAKATKNASAARKKELKEIIASCQKIAHLPPESFRDAIQLHWFVNLGVMFGDSVGLVVPGHLDRTLWPFYQKDLKQQIITPKKALLLIESMYILINDYIPDGLAMSVMVGGKDPKGKDTTNELSYLCLEALRRTNMVYPTVGICWHEKTPEALSKLAVELIAKGYSTPAFFGDKVIQKGLKHYGVPPEESCNYINSTCVEITPSRSSGIWVASPYFSTCHILLDEINHQIENDSIASDFKKFFKAYCKRLGEHIKKAAKIHNETRKGRRLYGRKPFQSIFTNDCLEKGRDIDDGGARYNWVECSFVGLANLADSLFVIKNEVYDKNTLSLPKLKKLLDTDFKGNESQRLHFLNVYPKYGNDCRSVDEYVKKTADFAKKECAKYKIAPGKSHFIPGAFCWIMHEQLGRKCGATPDGRKAGFPFADGGGPAQGREKCGPTAAIMSTTSWDHSCLIGGLAFNMKFNKSLFDSPDAIQRLKDLIITFLKRGGFETQINVVDYETLKKARKDPENYRDLVVRIGGYTDYFTRLSPEMQDEVMLRTGFNSI